MSTYEFSTQVRENGQLVLPMDVRKTVPTGSAVHVILHVAEKSQTVIHKGQPAIETWPTPEEVVERILQTPPNPNNISGSNALLVAALLNPVAEPDEPFDLHAWQAMWIRREAEMKAASLAHEATEWEEFTPYFPTITLHQQFLDVATNRR